MRQLALACALFAFTFPPSQDPARPPGALVFTNVRILPASGPAIDGGSILVEGGRIKAVGKSISIPSDAKVVDLSGRTVIPGLVDAASGLFLQEGEAISGGSADHDVVDSLDFFDDRAPREALASGVTTVCVSPPSRGVLLGLAAVVRVAPESPRVLKRGAALKMTLGSTSGETSTSPQRRRDYTALKDTFESAKKYREAWEKYRKEFEEYEKKKKEWDEKKKPAPKKPEPKADEPKKDEPKKEEPKKEEPKPEPGPKAPELEPQDAPPAKAAATEEPKKPSKPRLDPRSEILVQALDAKAPLPVRVEAHAIDTLELALKLADEFKLKMILDQATEGHLLADAIAKSKTPVAVGPVFRYGLPRVDYLNATLDTAATLAQSGVEVSIASFPLGGAPGRGPGAGRFLLEAAAWAASRGLTREQALQSVTLHPARQLGIADQVGSIAPDRLADLVVLSGDPFEPGTRIERVYAAGIQVWTAPDVPPAAEAAKAGTGSEAIDTAAGDLLLLKGARVIPVVGGELPEGSVLFAGGKIHTVAATIEASKGATVVDLPKGSVLVPGFIDLHSHLAASFESEETTESITPHVRAVEAFASTHRDARAAVRSGVTLVALAPGDLNLVGGRPGLVRLNGERLDRMVWKDAHGLKLALGREPLRRDSEPTSRAGAYQKLKELIATDGGDVRKILIDRKEPALVHARLADDIVRLAELKTATGIRAVLVHGDEAHRAVDAIKASGLGVAFGPMTVADTAEVLSTPGRLAREGIPVAFVSDAPDTGEDHLRVMAALAIRYGLSPDEALRALTIVPATLLGIEASFGSLEAGKQGDAVVYSGDPRSLASDVELVVVEGRIVYRKPKK